MCARCDQKLSKLGPPSAEMVVRGSNNCIESVNSPKSDHWRMGDWLTNVLESEATPAFPRRPSRFVSRSRPFRFEQESTVMYGLRNTLILHPETINWVIFTEIDRVAAQMSHEKSTRSRPHLRTNDEFGCTVSRVLNSPL